MPLRREWRQPEHEVIAVKPRPVAGIENAPAPSFDMPECPKPAAGTARNRRGLKIAIAAACAAILATIGATAFFILQKHNVTIEIMTNAGITAAKIGTQQLPAATPDENGIVAYTVQLKNGSYTFVADGDNGMTVAPKEIQVLSADVTQRLVLPDPTATPVPLIMPQESEWLYADENGGYYIVSSSGKEAVSGIPECQMYSYTVVLKNWQATDACLAVIGKVGTAAVDWTPADNDSTEYSFHSSEDSCRLCLLVDDQWKTIAHLQANSSQYVDGEAISTWKKLEDLDDAILFVGTQNSANIEQLKVEKLTEWAVDYPELYETYRPVKLHLALDDRLRDDAQVTVKDMAWTPDTKVYLAGEGQADLSFDIQSGNTRFSEALAVKDAIGEEDWTLGKEKCDSIRKKWAKTSIVIYKDEIILPLEHDELQKDMEDFPGVFNDMLHTVPIEIDNSYVKTELIKSVQVADSNVDVNGKLDENGHWKAEIQATSEDIDLVICFENGAKVAYKTDLYVFYCDYKEKFEATDSAATFTDGTVVFLKDGAIADGVTQDDKLMFEILGLSHEQYDVEVNIDSRIKPEVAKITFAERPIEELSQLSAGEYQVTVAVQGDGESSVSMKVSAEGENSLYFLTKQASDAIRDLVLWGTEDNMLRKDSPLLTQEAIEDEWENRVEKGRLVPVTVMLPGEESINEYEWSLRDIRGYEYVLQPTDDDANSLMLQRGETYLLFRQTKQASGDFVDWYLVTGTSGQEWHVKAGSNSTEPPATDTPAPEKELEGTPAAEPTPSQTSTSAETPTLDRSTPSPEVPENQESQASPEQTTAMNGDE